MVITKDTFTPYHAESRAVAREITKGVKTDEEKYGIITRYVDRHFAYDYIRAITVPKKNGTPDVKRCWDKKMGICMDIIAIAVGMMREVGLKAEYCIGQADRSSHAWVECEINGVMYRYDYGGKKAKAYNVKYRF